jgi:hypothetical protein
VLVFESASMFTIMRDKTTNFENDYVQKQRNETTIQLSCRLFFLSSLIDTETIMSRHHLRNGHVSAFLEVIRTGLSGALGHKSGQRPARSLDERQITWCKAASGSDG